jgi:hypothetical protein
MKIIFLDIDGVLNSYTDFLESSLYGHPFNTGKIVISSGKLCLLEYIVRNTDAKIVISSTWRSHFTLDEIYEMFKVRGFKLPRKVIIDKTETHRHGFSSGPEYFRKSEIKEWLKANKPIESYVILDDIRPSFFEGMTDNLVTTRDDDGLNRLSTEQAITILGRNKKSQAKQDKYNESLDLLLSCI